MKKIIVLLVILLLLVTLGFSQGKKPLTPVQKAKWDMTIECMGIVEQHVKAAHADFKVEPDAATRELLVYSDQLLTNVCFQMSDLADHAQTLREVKLIRLGMLGRIGDISGTTLTSLRLLAEKH